MLQVEREGLILNYRLGRKTQYPKMSLIKVLNVGPSESKQMIGWKVAWPAGLSGMLHGALDFARAIKIRGLTSAHKVFPIHEFP